MSAVVRPYDPTAAQPFSTQPVAYGAAAGLRGLRQLWGPSRPIELTVAPPTHADVCPRHYYECPFLKTKTSSGFVNSLTEKFPG